MTAARLLQDRCTRGGFRGRVKFLTLTYRDGADWRPDHVRELVNRLRSRFARKGHALHYCWTAELQRRGAIHYHLLVWLPRGVALPYLDKAGLWCHGSTQIQTARNAVGYVAKYASKVHGGHCDPHGRLLRYPKGARLCGAGGFGADRWRSTYWTAPRWARDRVASDHGQGERRLRRCKGGWADLDSGDFYPSPWVCLGVASGGAALLFRQREVTE